MSPDDLLDALAVERDEAARELWFERLVARFPVEELGDPVRRRLDHLGGPDGPLVLRLVEWVRSPEVFDALADRLRSGPSLPADQEWLAITLLHDFGRIDHDPELRERLAEFDDLLGDEAIADDLADQVQEDAGQPWLALEGLDRVEPDIRAEIIGELGRRADEPGVEELLRLLGQAHDPTTRAAARSALARRQKAPETALAVREREQPVPVRILTTSVDGQGRGLIVVTSARSGTYASAVFLCDVLDGVMGVEGRVGGQLDDVGDLADWIAESPERDVVEGHPELALGLLAGCLYSRGETSPLALPYWLEATLGDRFVPRLFPGLISGWDPASFPAGEVPAAARLILDTCPDWLDGSRLTFELARSILLRDPAAEPDPVRDVGSYRFLFERRLQERLEEYRRMLCWMSAFWVAAGDEPLGKSALAIAWQLGDPAQAVPSQPFLSTLTTRSLAGAIRTIREGNGPRQAVGSP